MVIIQHEINNEYEYEFICVNEIKAPEVNLKLMFAVTAGYVIYSFVNSNVFPETMMRFTYKAVLVYTKVNRAYNKLTTYFSNMINRDKTNNNNNNNNNIELINSELSSANTDSFTDYEIRIIKNGIKCEQFETIKKFKESNYLGNPNDYCDSQDEESQSQSSTNESCDVCDDVCDSQEDDDVHAGATDDGGNQEKITTHMTVDKNDKNEQLFIMKHNKQNNTIRFIAYDFIMQTFFSDNGKNCGGSSYCYNKLNKNYTRLYRQFTENDYLISPNDLVISKMGMIVCSLELNGKTYDIDISFPYNFNVVGNVILDYTFLSWYMLKEYDVASLTDCDSDYTLTCISNAVTTYKLGKSSGLLVKLNEYEIVNV
jgi:hypothetical protein